MRFMTQQASGSESAEQLIDAFRVIANDSVSLLCSSRLILFFFVNSLQILAFYVYTL